MDYILWLLGNDQAVSVHSMGAAFDPAFSAINCPDVAISMIKFKSGVTATVDVGYRSHYRYDLRAEVTIFRYYI